MKRLDLARRRLWESERPIKRTCSLRIRSTSVRIIAADSLLCVIKKLVGNRKTQDRCAFRRLWESKRPTKRTYSLNVRFLEDTDEPSSSRYNLYSLLFLEIEFLTKESLGGVRMGHQMGTPSSVVFSGNPGWCPWERPTYRS